jgi:hypothetical protein
MSERNWNRQYEIDFEEAFVLGLPNELMPLADGSLQPRPAIIPVTILDDVEENTIYPRFVGRLFDNVTLESMEGMSGGPIFGVGLSPDGMRRYWVIAIQSSWLPTKRIVFGCPVPVFASLVEYKLQQFDEDRRETQ